MQLPAIDIPGFEYPDDTRVWWATNIVNVLITKEGREEYLNDPQLQANVRHFADSLEEYRKLPELIEAAIENRHNAKKIHISWGPEATLEKAIEHLLDSLTERSFMKGATPLDMGDSRWVD